MIAESITISLRHPNLTPTVDYRPRRPAARVRRRRFMSGDASFQDLIRRVRTGDGDAATRLVHDYEADVRRVIRFRLRDSSLRKLLDSVDIWQSVLANFFVRAASGQFELDTPDQLRNLLVTMACNRLNDQAR